MYLINRLDYYMFLKTEIGMSICSVNVFINHMWQKETPQSLHESNAQKEQHEHMNENFSTYM